MDFSIKKDRFSCNGLLRCLCVYSFCVPLSSVSGELTHASACRSTKMCVREGRERERRERKRAFHSREVFLSRGDLEIVAHNLGYKARNVDY